MVGKYLDGKLLCEKLNVSMYQRIEIFRNNCQVFGRNNAYFITPLGVAVVDNDGKGLFDTNCSKELYEGSATILKEYDEFISPKKVRYNKHWVEELELQAGFSVRTKNEGTVGTMKVPAVRFKKRQYER